ncbi:hypothetical protein HPB51_001463 [Rhipicephalus microplus]|uniref:SCP domain-containing protein n=1 Tax=Rhipicephalus microplus TaxID=6941 RepID=A0A9J6DS78_RHIMP|nr:hypothetical protein HPB51_001463 [Rhipicephalus microplus]
MRDAAISLLVGLFLFTMSCPADALPSTCRPEYQKLSGGLVHTACKPPNNNCIFVSTGLNMAEKADVLKAHNDFRSRVAQGQLSGFPGATNMYRMKWDDDLAQVAQAFTNLCDDRHDKEVQRKTSKFPKVGQNIAWNYEPTQTEVIDSAGRVKDWFDEYQDFNPGNVDPFRVSPGRVVTHFTQLVHSYVKEGGCDNRALGKAYLVSLYGPGVLADFDLVASPFQEAHYEVIQFSFDLKGTCFRHDCTLRYAIVCLAYYHFYNSPWVQRARVEDV